MPIECFSVQCTIVIAIELFLSLMHHSGTVARNKNIYFRWSRILIEFFLGSMHHSSTLTRNGNIFFGGGRVAIVYFPCPIYDSFCSQKYKQYFYRWVSSIYWIFITSHTLYDSYTVAPTFFMVFNYRVKISEWNDSCEGSVVIFRKPRLRFLLRLWYF